MMVIKEWKFERNKMPEFSFLWGGFFKFHLLLLPDDFQVRIAYSIGHIFIENLKNGFALDIFFPDIECLLISLVEQDEPAGKVFDGNDGGRMIQHIMKQLLCGVELFF